MQSFDELLIVLRRDSGLRFDEGLPGWHMYGTDIVQTARARLGRAAPPLVQRLPQRHPGCRVMKTLQYMSLMLLAYFM